MIKTRGVSDVLCSQYDHRVISGAIESQDDVATTSTEAAYKSEILVTKSDTLGLIRFGGQVS